jgi:outer membrane protein
MKKLFLYGIILLVWTAVLVTTALAQEYTLSDLYQQALKNSEKMKMAQENINIAQYGKDKAWAILMPRVTAFGTYNRFSEEKYNVSTSNIALPSPPFLSGSNASIDTSVLVQPSESVTWGVRADQSFSLSVRELTALKVAGQTITKNEFDLDATKSDFVLIVASAYYDVMKAKKGLEIAAANMERLTQYRNSVEKRLRVGDVTKTALLRSEGELSGASADYIKATNAFQLARFALVRITGIEDEFRLKETPLPAQDNISLTNLRNIAFDRRADLKSYDMQAQIAQGYVSYARGAFWPNVNLAAIYNRVDQNPATQTLNRESLMGMVSLQFPFFEGGLRVAEYREAKAKERQAKLAYADFKKSVGIELQGAYLDLQTQKGVLQFSEDQLAFAQDNYGGVVRQFDNGLSTNLDVMDANSLLLTAEKNVAEAYYNYQLVYLRVKRSNGTLLQFVISSNQ